VQLYLQEQPAVVFANQYLINFYRFNNDEKLLTPEELQSEMTAANQRIELDED